MEQLKKWEKTSNGLYTFYFNNEVKGSLEIAMGTAARKGIAKIDGQVFEIKKTGAWKNKIEISDQNEKVIAKLYPEKWYTATSILEYGGKIYRIIARNNPLAEYAIQYDKKDVLSYGLESENKKIKIRITSLPDSDLLLDFLMWYLFVPVAHENCSDDMLFLILIAAA